MANYDFQVTIFIGGVWVNVSDYVNEIDSIPFIERNRDFEAVVSEFNISISKAVTATIEKDQDVLIYNGSNIVFTGYIGSIKNNFNARVWDVRVVSHLGMLQNYFITYDELHNDLVNNAASIEEYCPAVADFEGYESVQCLYLIKRMFAIAGLTIFETEIEDVNLFSLTKSGKTEGYTIKDVRIDEFVLYAINQSRVYKYDGDPSNVYQLDPALKITFFDFLKIFCSITGTFLAPRAHKRFLFYHASLGSYTVADDYNYNYESEEISALESDYNFVMNFAIQDANWRAGYHLKGGGFPIEQVNEGDGNESIQWYQNLFFLLKENWKVNITNATHSGGYVTIYVDDITTYYDEEGFYIIVENVSGMLDLNGVHQIVETDYLNKWIKVQLTTSQTYTSGGTVRHAGSSWYNYWNPNENDVDSGEASGLRYKKRIILNNYTKENVVTEITLDKYSAVKNQIDIAGGVSIIDQESY